MVTIEYGEAFFADPHPTYARLRDQAAAVPVRDPNGLEYWLVTRYQEAQAALADPSLSKDPRHAWERLRDVGMVTGAAANATPSMLTTDPPEHTRLRTAVGKAFSPRKMGLLRPRIQHITDRLLDGVAEDGEVDLIDSVAFPLSVTVLCELLGVSLEDRDDFRTWTTAAHTPTYITTGSMPRWEGGRRVRDYVAELISRRRSETAAAQDLVGTLVADSGSRLTDGEVIETVSHLLLAGQDATTNLIGNGMAALFSHPDQLALVRHRPELTESAIEELMRYDGPTARSSPRVAIRDVELGTVTIPAGGIVIVGLSAANRDPARFTDPERLDITRADNPHLALGHGSHYCVSAPLARLTGQIVIGTLLRRFPHIALACRPTELRWRPTPVFRGLTGLPVTTSARSAQGPRFWNRTATC